MSTPLERLGGPLAFAVDETSTDAGFDAPGPRFGHAQRARVRSLGDDSMQKEALVTDSRSGRTWRLASDEGDAIGGDDVAPAPLAHMTTGMVSSFMTELVALADERDVELRDATLVQDNYYTVDGSALQGTMTGGVLPVDLEARVDADATDDQLAALVETAVARAPVCGLMRDERDSAFTLTLDGDPVAPDRVRAVDGERAPDPAEAFAGLVYDAPEHDPARIRRTGRSSASLRDGASEGLQEGHDGILHLRGTCRLQDDGTKHVEVAFFPDGTVFEFRSDEPAGHGGAGRAPDAMSYVAAGLGFCFMTQLGRYAHPRERDLSGYRIVQDTHVASGGDGDERTGDSGRSAAPVETHVFLDSPEDEAFAREALDASEQMCFLHALCRTALDGPTVEVTEGGVEVASD